MCSKVRHAPRQRRRDTSGWSDEPEPPYAQRFPHSSPPTLRRGSRDCTTSPIIFPPVSLRRQHNVDGLGEANFDLIPLSFERE